MCIRDRSELVSIYYATKKVGSYKEKASQLAKLELCAAEDMGAEKDVYKRQVRNKLTTTSTAASAMSIILMVFVPLVM